MSKEMGRVQLVYENPNEEYFIGREKLSCLFYTTRSPQFHDQSNLQKVHFSDDLWLGDGIEEVLFFGDAIVKNMMAVVEYLTATFHASHCLLDIDPHLIDDMNVVINWKSASEDSRTHWLPGSVTPQEMTSILDASNGPNWLQLELNPGIHYEYGKTISVAHLTLTNCPWFSGSQLCRMRSRSVEIEGKTLITSRDVNNFIKKLLTFKRGDDFINVLNLTGSRREWNEEKILEGITIKRMVYREYNPYSYFCIIAKNRNKKITLNLQQADWKEEENHVEVRFTNRRS